MIPRRIEPLVRDRLSHVPAVALIGPRQVAKTALAHAIAEGRKSVYLDLESQMDREKLTDAAFYGAPPRAMMNGGLAPPFVAGPL